MKTDVILVILVIIAVAYILRRSIHKKNSIPTNRNRDYFSYEVLREYEGGEIELDNGSVGTITRIKTANGTIEIYYRFSDGAIGKIETNRKDCIAEGRERTIRFDPNNIGNAFVLYKK